MSETYEQQETKGAMGGTEDSDPLTPAHDSNRAATSEAKSKGSRAVSARLSRVNRPIVLPGFMLGGILNQMLSDARDRLVEMKECVLWYEREVIRVQRRVTELEALAKSINSFDSDPEGDDGEEE